MRIILSILLLSMCYPQECGTEDMNEEENEKYGKPNEKCWTYARKSW